MTKSNVIQLHIDNIEVRTDEDGRYNLNDVHRAAGGESKSQPAYFFVLDSTLALLDEISNSRDSGIKPLNSKRGRYGGTFAVKEIIYAYAMWISPQFHLKVIRAYDRLVTQGVAVHGKPPANTPSPARLAH